jgi:hypothetical protein
MWHRMMAIFVIKYLREYESILETASAFEAGNMGVLFAEKKGSKSFETLSLKPQSPTSPWVSRILISVD